MFQLDKTLKFLAKSGWQAVEVGATHCVAFVERAQFQAASLLDAQAADSGGECAEYGAD